MSVIRGFFAAVIAAIAMPAAASAQAADKPLVDLERLIVAAARNPEQFAVPIPHLASVASSGTWTERGGRSIWRYSVEVDTAVSNALLLALLFAVGYRAGKHASARPWLVGSIFLLVGLALVAGTIALGG